MWIMCWYVVVYPTDYVVDAKIKCFPISPSYFITQPNKKHHQGWTHFEMMCSFFCMRLASGMAEMTDVDPQCEIRRQLLVLATFCSGSCYYLTRVVLFCTQGLFKNFWSIWWYSASSPSSCTIKSNMDQMGMTPSYFRVPVRRCIWLCFGYLIRELIFVFYKK